MTHTNERVAKVLAEELTPTIERWMNRVNAVPELTRIKLSYEERTGHLPQLLQDLITRLGLADNKRSPETTSAHDHGKVRFEQEYTVPMLVEESRLLQVSIFETLKFNHKRLDNNLLLPDVMIIADECDAQLMHTVETFMNLEKDGQLGGHKGLQIPA
jgi:hypothetical protein